MTKAELIEAVAGSAGVSKAEAERTLGAFFDHVVAATKKGDKVAWPGFGSFSYCTTQCSYDMPVFSPPGSPDIVYVGGAMKYSEIGGRSNGRAIQRSEDGGVNFTDMTIDANGVSLHPDQHAIAATPNSMNAPTRRSATFRPHLRVPSIPGRCVSVLMSEFDSKARLNRRRSNSKSPAC